MKQRDELRVIRTILALLESYDVEARQRILNYAQSRAVQMPVATEATEIPSVETASLF